MTIPFGWRRVRLDEVATLQTGLSKSRRVPARPVLRPYLRVANVQDGTLDLTDVKQIAVEEERVSRFELRSGDVLMTEGETSTSSAVARSGATRSQAAFTRITYLQSGPIPGTSSRNTSRPGRPLPLAVGISAHARSKPLTSRA